MEHSDFKVNIDRIPSEGLEKVLELSAEEVAGMPLAVPPGGALSARLSLVRLGDRVVIRGDIRTTVGLDCSRCLGTFTMPVESRVETSLEMQKGVTVDEERQLSTEELEIQPLEKGMVDLWDIIAEQVHLALPVQPLCADGCRGLCPRCGIDLNKESCDCGEGESDPRWDALKQLRVE